MGIRSLCIATFATPCFPCIMIDVIKRMLVDAPLALRKISSGIIRETCQMGSGEPGRTGAMQYLLMPLPSGSELIRPPFVLHVV